MRQLGFYNTSGTRTHVRFQFSTHAAAGGNVAPSSAFEAADIRIYRANDSAAFSATQRSSAAGITMTSPFDSLTGVHDVDIDLTDNTDAGFYASGYRYSVVLAPDETVDSQTITGIVLAEFEIGIPTVNTVQLSGDTGAADNAESFFDGTGYAGTNNVIPTVTNLTNAPTSGDLTATMKTSVATAADAAVTANSLVNAIAAYLDTEVAAIKAKTDQMAFTVANQLDVNVITKTGFKLASDGTDAVVVESGLNLRQATSIIAAALAGVLSGAATTTITIKAAGVPATTRITASVDADGNRSALTLVPPT